MTQKLRLEVPLLLPELPDERDECVSRLVALLQRQEGVEDVHLVAPQPGRTAELCVHFNPERVTFGDVSAATRRAGAALTAQYGHLLLRIEPTHAHRARTLTARLRQLDGVLDAEVSADGPVRIEFDRERIDEATLRGRLEALPVRWLPGPATTPQPTTEEPPTEEPPTEKRAPGEEHEEGHGGLFGERAELLFAVLSGAALLVGWLLSVLTNVSDWIPLGCYWAAYFFGGFFTLREAWENVLARRFEIDFLMLIAATGAAALGEWAEGALLLVLFSLGHALEHYAMGRARRAIEALAELAPQTATVRRDGQDEEVPVEALNVGDLVLVKPNERLPADGFVRQGTSSVNQAPVTGESVPVDKRPVDDPEAARQDAGRLAAAHRVFAGTINGSGALQVEVTRRSSESTLARVVQLVAEAETQKSPTQRFTDRFERLFVPAVLGLVVLSLFAWVVIDEPFSKSFYRAMAVLVAASPCALAIATPSAVLSAVARAGRGGVLVKGGGPLEHLGRLQAIAFDKTGTLTEGKPRLVDVVPGAGVADEELLRTAVAVEQLSDHPLAAAIVRAGRERLNGEAIAPAHDLRSITGRGVQASVDGQTVWIGKDDLFQEIAGPPLPDAIRQSVEQLERDGRTTMIVRRGDSYLGVLGLMDTPREPAARVIARLRELGIQRMLMISGDNQHVAEAIAAAVGLDEARGDLMPEDKVETIKQLRQTGGVAMVGDGVNDAPAMAQATVGIAMGAAGSDVALETADIALMADDLNHLPLAIGLSRQASRIIRQNLWLSLGVVAFLIPATLLGLRIGPAVAMHEGSTLVVVFNALRLLAYRDSKERPTSPRTRPSF